MLETERIMLRTFNIEDSNFLYELNNDKRVNKYLSYDSMSMEKCIDYINAWINNFGNKLLNVYNVVLKKTNESIGLIFLVRREEQQKIELGYRFLPDYWGNGYCSEAAEVLIKTFFNKSDEDKIYAETHYQNVNSISLLHKVGFNGVSQDVLDEGRLFILYKKDILD
ncbi:N-acetyltransferase [Vallitalea longa]|uniref:N-acetyltransferase n=1 Tax=Vallitalea longa TaxID=2936439 RepID=A0A9W6DED3_9FIRM|nr:GNAT family N-acetyltransferase [Vallitalea longa]GKX28323.1 N-acetyltransferase [Vallitalea longa]